MRRERWTDRGDTDGHRQNETGFQNFGIRLSTHRATEPVSNVNDTNASDRELERSENAASFISPIGPKLKSRPSAKKFCERTRLRGHTKAT